MADTNKEIEALKKQLAAAEEKNAKLTKQVESAGKKPVKVIDGEFTSDAKATKGKKYRFRDNIAGFYGSKGVKLDSEQTLKAAAEGDESAIAELERLVKLDAAFLIEVKAEA